MGLIVYGFLSETMEIVITRPNQMVHTDLVARSLMASQKGHNRMAAAFRCSLDFSPLAPPANEVPA